MLRAVEGLRQWAAAAAVYLAAVAAVSQAVALAWRASRVALVQSLGPVECGAWTPRQSSLALADSRG